MSSQNYQLESDKIAVIEVMALKCPKKVRASSRKKAQVLIVAPNCIYAVCANHSIKNIKIMHQLVYPSTVGESS